MRPQKIFVDQEIAELKEHIINRALTFGTWAGWIAYLISFTPNRGIIPLISDLTVLTSFTLITVFRRKISIQVKTYVILVGIFATVLSDVYDLGVLGANKSLIILIPFFATVYFTVKRTIALYAIMMVSVAVLAYMHIFGMLQAEVETIETVTGWIINLLMTSIVAFVLFLIVREFNQKYESLIERITTSNREAWVNQQNYREIFNSTADLILMFNQKDEIVDHNQSISKLYGIDNDQEISDLKRRLLDTNDEYSLDRFESFLKEVKNSNRCVFDWQIKREDDDLVWVEITLKKAIIGDEEIVLAVIRDNHEKKLTDLQLIRYKEDLENIVEERTRELEKANKTLTKQTNELKVTVNKLKSAQDQLVQSEKMASLGLLASGVAHEINNPLNFIKGGVEGLETYLDENKLKSRDDSIEGFVESIHNGVDRASQIVTGLNQYSRSVEQFNESCDINAILRNCAVLVQSELRSGIQLNLELFEALPLFQGNSGKLHQAFLNILTNADQAIKADQGLINAKTYLDEKSIHIEISDDGMGIPKKIINKISDPFFTTKEVGTGTGLGLYIVFNIIEEHQGSIKFQSKVGEGTTVHITLPLGD